MITEEEVEHGIGFFYPAWAVDLAVSLFEASGRLLHYEELLNYNPEWLQDINRRIRLKRSLVKDGK